MNYKETLHGFEWGPMEVARAFSHEKAGRVTLLLYTEQYPAGMAVHVTRTGKVRVFAGGEEWKPA